MRPLALIPLVLAAAAGCASKPPQAAFGSFGAADQGVPVSGSARMADDVTRQLASIYAPARSKLYLRHAAPDQFGMALLKVLRLKGYAVAEFKAVQPVGQPAQAGDYAIAYVIDQPLDAGVYRVTVHINVQSLTRIYQAKDGTVAPAGYWVRKE